MKVMVTVNVETDLDIANGSQGVITGLVLDEADKDYNRNAEEVNLTRPPLYILVKLQQTSSIKLPGLEENKIPITPMCKNYMGLVGGQCKSIKCRQLPLTAAYSFTDYRSQGQIIPYIIVDIATPPSKGIMAFNIYVALSRSSGRDTIRLLRDFDPQLLMQHPSKFLRSEDKRLEDLNEKTKWIWESRIKSLYVHT
ncbi:hypothetical protein FRC03_001205 [Tulasnella sp. 419]|nr:hypothetical protein FRC03_001205 [Tulasnella sp. 419]